jgi:uncharacterized membrane protein YcaP (DUF421 family)
MQYIIIAASSAAIYVFLIAAIRLFGKKEFAQLSVFDLVFILLISNAVQNAMVGDDVSLLGGICSAVTLFVVNYAFKFIMYKFPKASELIEGQAVMLVYGGKYIDENLKKARISKDEIEEAAREHGVSSISEIDLAVLEADGNISILSEDFKKVTKKKRRRENKGG